MTDLSDLGSSAFWRVNPRDSDPHETREWLEAFDAMVEAEGRERATYLLRRLLDHARKRQVQLPPVLNTPYRNSVDLVDQPQFPGNLDVEQRLSSIVRWNALAMVVRANRAYPEIGGHIASYASAADLFEVGFNHFFRAGPAGEKSGSDGGDLVYFQPHSATGVYSRAFLEGRLSEEQLAHYRRETGIAGDAGLAAVMGELLLAQAPFEKSARVDARRRVRLKIDQVAAVASAFLARRPGAKEMVEADLEQIRRRGVARNVAAKLGIGAVGAHHHRQRIPAHDRGQALLDIEIAGKLRLVGEADAIAVRRVEHRRQLHAPLARVIEQPAQQISRALAAVGLDHCVERVEPFARLMRSGIPEIDAPESGGTEVGQVGHNDFLWQVRPPVYRRRRDRSDASAESAAGACVMSSRIAARWVDRGSRSR